MNYQMATISHEKQTTPCAPAALRKPCPSVVDHLHHPETKPSARNARPFLHVPSSYPPAASRPAQPNQAPENSKCGAYCKPEIAACGKSSCSIRVKISVQGTPRFSQSWIGKIPARI